MGIIKPEKPKEEIKEETIEYDLAPLKDKPEIKDAKNDNKNIKNEIKNLSPEMKKVIMSDILKPKF